MPRHKSKKRHRSSPTQFKSQTSKKHRTNLECGSDTSFYSADSESDSELQGKNMAPPKMSKEDVKEIAQLLLNDFKPELVNILRNEIKSLIHSEIHSETAGLRAEVQCLRLENESLKQSLKSTSASLDELDQYGRRMCLDVSNIPGDTGESSENVEKKILDHAKRVHLDLTSADIDRCHRKGKPRDNYNRKVVIKFTNSKARQRVYMARKDFGDGIFVTENLTMHRENLAYQARQLKRNNKLDKTWVAGAKIFGIMKSGDETKKIQIRDFDDIDKVSKRQLP